ncbi:LCP family protein [Pallidibacillus thermolactis]|uniref:LCP family protein n=1 Tax=Pallidibacillus thermolactis TaxID=251051 RepID=UPI002E245A4A|nr:LCP family protein [Pallidibacillus thermolactis subsp. kokeshiiformis]
MAYTRQNSRKVRKKRKLRKRGKVVIFILFMAFLAFISYGGYLYLKTTNMLADSYEADGREKSALRDAYVDPTKDNISILIVGADSSETREDLGNPRSDTLIYATLNKNENSIKLLSIPRDSLVYIPYLEKETKINSAYASKAGLNATIETVEHLLEVPVDYYVTLNFEAFIDIVDALGGITIDVPFEIYEQNSKDEANAIHLLPGRQKLNGEEALAFARTRKYDNDIERGKRQQQVIKAVFDKAMSVDAVLKAGEIIESIGDNLKTNLRPNEIFGLISYAVNGSGLNIESLTLEGYDYQPGRVYYYKLDEEALEKTKQTLQDHLEFNATNSQNYLTR